MTQENNPSTKPALRSSVTSYPAEVRRLGSRAIQIFDSLYQSDIEKGHTHAEAYFYAANYTPERYRAEQRQLNTSLEPT